jgi:hypothetical protein
VSSSPHLFPLLKERMTVELSDIDIHLINYSRIVEVCF